MYRVITPRPLLLIHFLLTFFEDPDACSPAYHYGNNNVSYIKTIKDPATYLAFRRGSLVLATLGFIFHLGNGFEESIKPPLLFRHEMLRQLRGSIADAILAVSPQK